MRWKCRLLLVAASLAGVDARVTVMTTAMTSAAAFLQSSISISQQQQRIKTCNASFININIKPLRRPRHCNRRCANLQQLLHASENGNDDDNDENESNRAANKENNITTDQVQVAKAKTKTRFRARVSYFGTSFSGWQLQPDKSTIQGSIESTLSRRFNRRVPVSGAGRTDAGVHARGQAIHFDLFDEELPFVAPPPPEGKGDVGGADDDWMAVAIEGENGKACIDFCNELHHSMNRMLPVDIRIFNLQLAPYTIWTTTTASFEPSTDDDDDSDSDDHLDEVDQDHVEPSLSLQQSTAITRARPWHAIQSAKSKWYSYRFTLGPTLWNPKERFTRTHFIHRPMFDHHRTSVDDEPYYALTPKDITRLQSILQLYEGTHDFKAFGGQLEQNEKRAGGKKINTIRTVHRVELVKEPLKDDIPFGGKDNVNVNVNSSETTLPPQDCQFHNQIMGFIGEEGNYRIDFLLQGALYKMVRNMVGTAMQVWLEKMSEDHLVELLQIQQEQPQQQQQQQDGVKEAGSDGLGGPQSQLEKQRDSRNINNKVFCRKDNPCKPAPPEGLTLECVYYDDQF